ncbi:MAG: hypothetical protein WCK05_04285, partial [Planctomycetota bacterium]
MEMARKTGVIVAMSVLLIATQAWAEVTYTKVTAASYDISGFGHTSLESQVSNIDLINTGQPSLFSTTDGMPLSNSSPSAHLNNGSQFDPALVSTAGVYYGNTTRNGLNDSYIPSNGATWDVILNGYFSIGKIVSYTGTEVASNRTRQDYTVAFSTNGGANFDAPTVFVNAAYETGGAAMQVTVENPGSALATNVNAMRFTFSGFKRNEAAYREIDVFQTPEPTLPV